MNLPIPPTDNLYKFAALLGSIIIFSSLYFPYTLMSKVREKTDFVTLKIATTNQEAEFTKLKIVKVKEILENSIALQKGALKHDSNKFTLSYSETELKNLINQNDELLKKNGISLAELEHYQAESIRLSREYQIIKSFMVSSLAIGCLLAFFGYYNWYNRIQIYQDQALKRSAINPKN